MNNNVEIIDTGANLVNINNQCPCCGARELKYNEQLGKIFCGYCHNTFEPKEIEGVETNLKELTTQRIGSGARDINPDFNSIMTYKCPCCGAEVVFDTRKSTQTKCHWCHSLLTINERIENGAVPDVILPFKVTKEEAMREINLFVNRSRTFALGDFKRKLNAENTVGVYLPYLLVDVNAHCKLTGEAEKLYNYNQGHNITANVYHIERDFNITIDDLSIESNSVITDKNSLDTNNIINAIMPFDTENCVKFESNYLVEHPSEKRDMNISNLKEKADQQIKDIIRSSVKRTINQYDRGVCWQTQDVNIFGTQWVAAYLPVWLYSYRQKNGVIHYIAVNARTKEIQGSIPLGKFKLNFLTIALIVFVCMMDIFLGDIFLTPLFFIGAICANLYVRKTYRNKGMRHNYEQETKYTVSNLVTNDTYQGQRTGLSGNQIEHRNDNSVFGS